MIARGSTAVFAFALALGLTAPAWPASQSSDAEFRAALDACKREATPKERDECVSNAENRYGRGQGAGHQDQDEDKEKEKKDKEKDKGGGKDKKK